MLEDDEVQPLLLQLLLLQPSLPPGDADAGAAVPDADQIEGLGEGLIEVPRPLFCGDDDDAAAAAELLAPSRGPRCSCGDLGMVLVRDHGENVQLPDPLSILQHPLHSPNMHQWLLIAPAEKDVGGKKGLE